MTTVHSPLPAPVTEVMCRPSFQASLMAWAGTLVEVLTRTFVA